MTEPTPMRPRQPQGALAFVLGVAIGAIPLVIWLVILGTAIARQNSPGALPYGSLGFILQGLTFSAALYIVMWIVSIPLLASERTRLVGQGMTVALIASPVIGYLGCTVIPNFVG